MDLMFVQATTETLEGLTGAEAMGCCASPSGNPAPPLRFHVLLLPGRLEQLELAREESVGRQNQANLGCRACMERRFRSDAEQFAPNFLQTNRC